MPNFPESAPIIQVMARVVHPEIDSVTKTYQGQPVKGWAPHSILVNVVRALHQSFELKPPIPESMAADPLQIMQPKPSPAVQELKIIKEIDDKVNFQEVHSQVNE